MAGANSGEAFAAARRSELWYAGRLRGVARAIDKLVHGLFGGRPEDAPAIQRALQAYAALLEPWAERVGARMLADVNDRNEKTWQKVAAEMGRSIRREIASAPTGVAMRTSLERQVTLIKSLPLQAAERVHKLAQESVITGGRGQDIKTEILRTGDVTKARAELIARTEIGRAQTELTRARAESIGCTHFIWRTAQDQRVREWHRRLNGQTFEIRKPPECDPGIHALPGQVFNCRCYMEPLIP